MVWKVGVSSEMILRQRQFVTIDGLGRQGHTPGDPHKCLAEVCYNMQSSNSVKCICQRAVACARWPSQCLAEKCSPLTCSPLTFYHVFVNVQLHIPGDPHSVSLLQHAILSPCGRCLSTCGCIYRVTLRVFGWGMLQQHPTPPPSSSALA